MAFLASNGIHRQSRFLLRLVWMLAFGLALGAVIVPAGARAQEAGAAEIEFWASVKETHDPAELKAYLQAYPSGHYAELARIRINKLTASNPPDAKPAEQETETAAPPPQGPNANIYKQLSLFGEVLERTRSEYVEKPDDTKLIERAINGMLQGLDPHSSYLTPKEFQDVQVQTRGEAGAEHGGLGIETTMEDGVVKVIAPIEDAPASRAGILAGDYITHLDGECLRGLTLIEAVEKMGGPVNSKVTVTILRKGVPNPIQAKAVRDIVRISPVRYSVEGDAGWIRLKSFQSEHTYEYMKQAVEDLKKTIGPKLKGYVIDLRNNPGGLLDQAISVSDAFLDKGAIVLTKGRNAGESSRANAKPGDITDGKPLVVLIDGASAAASEIVAGALQDHKRATLVGTRTFGSGTVQTMIPLGANGAMRLTTARFYTPSGRLIQAAGIEPDRTVEQELPADMSASAAASPPKSEAALCGHLKNASAPEAAGSASYVPKDKNKDTQLKAALALLQ